MRYKSIIKAMLELGAAWTLATSAAAQHSYAGQETRAIKALAPEDIAGYEGGKGMGLAKAAELNGYPGPSHVLELAAKLELSTQQRRATEALFRAMEDKARTLGRRLVDEERTLDGEFAARTVTPASLAASLQRIGELQAQVRMAHLEAHLAQVDVLTPVQVRQYSALRGYEDPAALKAHAGHR